MNPLDPMIKTNDPRLTDYVLGELAPAEAAQIEAALKSSPQLRAAVADIRQATQTIANVFETEPSLQLAPEQRTKLLAEAESVSEPGSAANTDVHSLADNVTTLADNVTTLADNVTPTVAGEHYRPSAGSTAHWIKIAVAAGLAGLLLGVGAYYSADSERPSIAASDEPMLAADSVDDGTEESELQSKDHLGFNADADSQVEQRAIKKLKASKPMSKTDGVADQAIPLAVKDAESAKLNGHLMQSLSANQPGSAPQSPSRPPLVADSFGDAMPPTFREEFPKTRSRADAGNAIHSLAEAPAESKYHRRSSALPNVEGKKAEAKKIESKFTSNLASNPAMLSKAQQSLDQSRLRSLNLKVVAQNSPSQSRQSIDQIGGDFHDSGADERLPIAAAAKPLAQGDTMKNELTKRSPNASLPVTFKLQISDQNAKRMVQLLASQADPLQQRKLSFEELIGLQKSPQVASANSAGESYAELMDESYIDDAGRLKMEMDSPPRADTLPKKSPSAPQTAAALLASELREHLRRPLSRNNSIAAYRGLKKQNVETLQDLGGSIDSDSASASDSPMDKSSTVSGKSTPENQSSVRSQDAKQKLPAIKLNNELSSGEFNFEYSQVIQQLKSNLEIRNQAVPLSKQSPARLPVAP